jgi:regulator of RNase E activity RraB
VPLFRRNADPGWEPDWQTFPGRVDEADVMLHADLGAVRAAPVEGLGVRLEIAIRFAKTRPDGSPVGEEMHQTYALEDRVTDAVAKRANGRYVGRVLGGGGCRFVAYLPGSAADGVPQLKLDPGPFQPELTVHDDPEWTFARAAFTPDPAAEQRTYNRPLVDALRVRGDRLEVPRAIEHSAHFADQKAATAAARELSSSGHVVSASPDDEGGATLTITRAAPLTEIDDATEKVLTIVRRHGGDYDGWGAELVR